MKLPEIEITIDGIKYDNSFNSDLQIDRTNLEEEFATHAEKYYYYAYLSQVARTKAHHKKIEVGQLYAVIDQEKRAGLAGIKHTEKMVENEVITDGRYQLAQKDLLQADLLANQLEDAARAMGHRRDMLIQLGGMMRQSMAPHRVVEQQAGTAQSLIAQTRAAAQPQLAEAPPSMPPAAPVRRRQPTP